MIRTLKSIKGILPLILLSIGIGSNAQQYNIVPNASFESYITCPSITAPSQLNNWYLATNAASYYINSCDKVNCAGVPNNCGGNSYNYQYPRTGNGYVLNLFYIQANQYPSWKRGYIQVQMKQPLQAGHCYYAGYYINLCNGLDMACDNAGLLFTNTAVYVDTVATPFGVLNATPQIMNYGNPIIKDTLNWIKVSGVFVATGGEEYITLGNFYDDGNTTIDSFKTKPLKHIVYNVDDVFVIPLDSMPLKADAGRDTTIHNGDSVFVGSLTNGITNITWYNSSGTIINTVAPGFWVHPSSSTFYVVEQTVCGYTSRDTINIGVILPLNFISYNIVPSLRGTKQSVENIWQTTNEINVSYFNIQRSVNGKDFITIGKVKAENKSYNEYNYIDGIGNWAFGINKVYYRIESVDRDGRKQYSVIRNVELGIRNGVSVYPNPSKDVVNIVGNNIKEVRIINYLGQEIASYLAMTSNDAIVINTKNFNKGLYIVQVITKNNEVKNEKLIVE